MSPVVPVGFGGSDRCAGNVAHGSGIPGRRNSDVLQQADASARSLARLPLGWRDLGN